MNKHLLIIQFLVLSITGLSQSRLGHALDSLKKEFRDPTYHAVVEGQDNSLRLEILTRQSKVIYFINPQSSICEITAIYPYSEEVKNVLIQKYNARHSIISPGRWKSVSDGIIYEIVLSQDALTGELCFIWTYRVEPS